MHINNGNRHLTLKDNQRVECVSTEWKCRFPIKVVATIEYLEAWYNTHAAWHSTAADSNSYDSRLMIHQRPRRLAGLTE